MATENIPIVIAQLDFWVGDIDANLLKMQQAITAARDEYHAALIIFPELALCGYPPEDLLFRSDFIEKNHQALQVLQQSAIGIDVILGHPHQTKQGLFNAASLLRDQSIHLTYHKRYLPNTHVFDEKRYFTAGEGVGLFDLSGIPVALMICEDIWHPDPMNDARAAGAEMVIVINASPFSDVKIERRHALIKMRAQDTGIPIVYVNLVGGQDDLVFDGGSFIVNAKGDISQSAPFCQEILFPCMVTVPTDMKQAPILSPQLSTDAQIYQALCLGLRDYVRKNGFQAVLLGLSGGIDSALTLAIAVDALGADAVEVLLMPSQYTAEISVIDATLQAQTMGVKYQSISIESVFAAFLSSLAPAFMELTPDPIIAPGQDITAQNLQARCRGMILMALSNKTGKMVLSTGNKSETAVGYCTLYGDMVGGLDVLKDVSKERVYRLAHYRNAKDPKPIIPERVLTRAPSAELAPNQIDQDHLPPYPILDEILKLYVEQDFGIDALLDASQILGMDRETVLRVINMIDHNEYKRRQGPPGIRVTERAFGRDRRYPISSGYSVCQ